MNYEEFKYQFLQELKDYLPAEYQDWQLEVKDIPKVNGFLEGLHLLPEKGTGVSPTLYLRQLYDYYNVHRDLGRTCKKAADVFIAGMECMADLDVKAEMKFSKEKVVFSLISSKGNERLLEMVPHRKTLDLAVIYRILVGAADSGFNSAIVNHTMAEEMEITEEELYLLALNNTPRIMEVETRNMDDQFLILSNRQHVLGAATLLYPGALAGAAERLRGNLYILPSSIHEVFLVPDVGQDVTVMNKVVAEANETVVRKEEILSEHVYYYDKASDKVMVP